MKIRELTRKVRNRKGNSNEASEKKTFQRPVIAVHSISRMVSFTRIIKEEIKKIIH